MSFFVGGEVNYDYDMLANGKGLVRRHQMNCLSELRSEILSWAKKNASVTTADGLGIPLVPH